MIILNTEEKITNFLDEESMNVIMQAMEDDATTFLNKIHRSHRKNWVGRVSLFSGADHEDSQIPLGFLLHYACRETSEGMEMGVIEIKIPQSSDEYSVLQLEVNTNQYHQQKNKSIRPTG